ncbi:DUF2188 domain-containing protein [Deltaproteobacteria bacterium OttesenSCG-928-M10]|nr:DUF2188 domain-containing protein [Deltaproteobacteria bacterium OttesenSCG-928-M10]
MTVKEHHIVPNPTGGWSVKGNDAAHASIYTETKADAVKIGRVISQRSGSELVIHGRGGNIQKADKYPK